VNYEREILVADLGKEGGEVCLLEPGVGCVAECAEGEPASRNTAAGCDPQGDAADQSEKHLNEATVRRG
jgi:hypothetical protein